MRLEHGTPVAEVIRRDPHVGPNGSTDHFVSRAPTHQLGHPGRDPVDDVLHVLGEHALSERRESTVAATKPQRVCPMTTTSSVPKVAAANSTLPTIDGATTLPATRTTNRSPSPQSKSNPMEPESEQESTIANGFCPRPALRAALGCPASRCS